MPSQDLNPGCRTQSPAHWPLDYSRLTDIFILQVVLTTLLVACSASFVLNAYNFLFLKRFAIYVWFAIAPLIWVVCPLTGAAWVTKTYVRYKLVVVNAWVDIPEVWWFFLLLTLLSVNDSDVHNWDLNSHFTQSIKETTTTTTTTNRNKIFSIFTTTISFSFIGRSDFLSLVLRHTIWSQFIIISVVLGSVSWTKLRIYCFAELHKYHKCYKENGKHPLNNHDNGPTYRNTNLRLLRMTTCIRPTPTVAPGLPLPP